MLDQMQFIHCRWTTLNCFSNTHVSALHNCPPPNTLQLFFHMGPYFPFLHCFQPCRKQWRDSLDMWDPLRKTRKFLFSLLKVYQNECDFNILTLWKRHLCYIWGQRHQHHKPSHSLLPETGRRNSGSVAFPLTVTFVHQEIGCNLGLWGLSDFHSLRETG